MIDVVVTAVARSGGQVVIRRRRDERFLPWKLLGVGEIVLA